MQPLWLRVRAPFAAYRWMQAGAYRASMPVMPPSAAHGLVLNIAGVDTRGDTLGASTQVRPDMPAFEVALGITHMPGVTTLYQQVHGYPVGSSSKEFKDKTFGAKYHIAPVRRELLVGLDMTIGLRGIEVGLADRLRWGLRGELPERRYGLPFAGDNNLLIDRIDLVPEPAPQCWLERITGDEGVRQGSTRLTVSIDRASATGTRIALHAPTTTYSTEPPAGAWTWTPKPPT